MPKRTNNPNGRPKTSADHKRRRFYATVTASPAEASELDAQRGDTDRATFLLCCDEAERRGVTFLDAGDGSSGMWGLPRARNLNQWDAPLRPALIAALARALRDSA